MFCKQCGYEVKNGDKFCSSCGSKVKQNEIIQELGNKEEINSPLNDGVTEAVQDNSLKVGNQDILKKRIVISAIYIFALLCVCFITPNNSLVGKWEDMSGEKVIFTSSGEIESAYGVGKYKVIEKDMVATQFGYNETVYAYYDVKGTELSIDGEYYTRSIFTISPFDYIVIIIGLVILYILLKDYCTSDGLDWKEIYTKLKLKDKFVDSSK